jgi:hypothetical protein
MNTLQTGSRLHRNVAPSVNKASPPRRQQSAASASRSPITAMCVSTEQPSCLEGVQLVCMQRREWSGAKEDTGKLMKEENEKVNKSEDWKWMEDKKREEEIKAYRDE